VIVDGTVGAVAGMMGRLGMIFCVVGREEMAIGDCGVFNTSSSVFVSVAVVCWFADDEEWEEDESSSFLSILASVFTGLLPCPSLSWFIPLGSCSILCEVLIVAVLSSVWPSDLDLLAVIIRWYSSSTQRSITWYRNDCMHSECSSAKGRLSLYAGK